jgi:DNA-directed RNA polymerase specialized sigma24 family protein
MTDRRGAMEPSEELSRLLALQIRLSLENQTQAIIELGKAGFEPARIAELLGTSPATARVTLQKARAKKSKGEPSDG